MRWWLPVIAGALLGCSGVSTGLAEWLTGADLEVAEDGTVTMTAADGSTQVITQGDQAERPEGFALPEPGEGASLESVVASEDGFAHTLVYRLEPSADADVILDIYREWMVAREIQPAGDRKNIAGMRTEALVGTGDGAVYSVTYTDGLGNRLLTLGVTRAR